MKTKSSAGRENIRSCRALTPGSLRCHRHTFSISAFATSKNQQASHSKSYPSSACVPLLHTMENLNSRNSIPTGMLGEGDIAKAAADFLASSSERRKRARASSANNGEFPRKRLDNTKPQSANMDTARKAAADLMRESPSYRNLVRMEEKLDLAIMRKQQDIKESLKSQSYFESRVFRLYLFNTYRSQPGAAGTTEDDVPSWSLRIQGRLLNKSEERPSKSNNSTNQERANQAARGIPSPVTDPVGPGVPILQSSPSISLSGVNQNAQVGNPNTPLTPIPGAPPGDAQQSVITGQPPKCSDIFKRIVIELDKEFYPENNLIEWKRNDKEPSSDGFEISRSGDKEFTAKIFLYIDHKPEQFRLSHALSRLIGVKTDTKKGIFAGVWQYIKKNRLQCVDDRSAVRLDQGLKGLLGPMNANMEVLKLQQLFTVVKSHMGPPEPLMIEYEVKLNGDVVDNQDCYDIQVNVQDTTLLETARKAGVFGLELPQSAEFEALREKHLFALVKIAEHKKRRDFFKGFCSNPVQFINHLILSQTRDLKVLGGSTGRNPEEERKAAFYQQQWVHEAVPRYLLRKAIADTADDTGESTMK